MRKNVRRFRENPALYFRHRSHSWRDLGSFKSGLPDLNLIKTQVRRASCGAISIILIDALPARNGAARASSARVESPERKMLKIKKLEHVLIGKVDQLFRNML